MDIVKMVTGAVTPMMAARLGSYASGTDDCSFGAMDWQLRFVRAILVQPDCQAMSKRPLAANGLDRVPDQSHL